MNAMTQPETAGLATKACMPSPQGRQKSPTLHEEAKWYLDQALEFERSKQVAQRHLTQLAWRVAIGAGVIAVFAIVGATALVELKKPNPPAILRDNTASGKVDVLDVVRDGQVAFGELEDRADLRRYVTMRESYDWETIQSSFDAVKLMSAARERDQYVALFGLPNAPQKILKDQFRVVAHVGAITFVGTTAQVFFSRKVIALGGGLQPKTEYWVATIAYRHDNLPEMKSELEIDPTGFRVTSYSVDRDWTRAPDDGAAMAAPQVATAPSGSPRTAAGGDER